MIIFNPGTEARADADVHNAATIAVRIFDDIKADLGGMSIGRRAEHDRDGWFRYQFQSGKNTVDVDIPGDDPDVVCESTPFKSRRLYVNGNSWLYGFAVGLILEKLSAD